MDSLLFCVRQRMAETDVCASIGPSAQAEMTPSEMLKVKVCPQTANGTSNFVYLGEVKQLVGLCAWWAFKTWGKYNRAYTFTKRIESFTEHCNLGKIPLTVLYLNQDGLPLGMASLRSNDGIRPDIGPWLGSVYVDPSVRRLGIGAKLVKEIERKAKELGYEKIFLLTYEETLPNWYLKLGWKETGEDVCHGNPVTVMEIDLG